MRTSDTIRTTTVDGTGPIILTWHEITPGLEQFALRCERGTLETLRERWEDEGQVELALGEKAVALAGQGDMLTVVSATSGQLLAEVRRLRSRTLVCLVGDRWLSWVTPSYGMFLCGFVEHQEPSQLPSGPETARAAGDPSDRGAIWRARLRAAGGRRPQSIRGRREDGRNVVLFSRDGTGMAIADRQLQVGPTTFTATDLLLGLGWFLIIVGWHSRGTEAIASAIRSAACHPSWKGSGTDEDAWWTPETLPDGAMPHPAEMDFSNVLALHEPRHLLRHGPTRSAS